MGYFTPRDDGEKFEKRLGGGDAVRAVGRARFRSLGQWG